jgi:hypothetical protein
MQGILLRTLIAMLGLFLASRIIPGVSIEGTGTFILAALLLGLVNALVRPIAFLMTLPLTIITLSGRRLSRQFYRVRLLGRCFRRYRCGYFQYHRVLVHWPQWSLRSLRSPSSLNAVLAGNNKFS